MKLLTTHEIDREHYYTNNNHFREIFMLWYMLRTNNSNFDKIDLFYTKSRHL